MSSSLKVSYYVMQKLEELSGGSLIGSVILDFGCGFGRNGHLIRTYVDKGGSDAYLVGCDISKKYLVETKRFNPYNELVQCDIRHLPFRFGIASHVIASEIIEHLEKEEGKEVLHAIEEVCDGSIILTTPYFPYEQAAIRNNPFERHRSHWKDNEFKGNGFETECRGYEELFGIIVRRLRLDKLFSKIVKIAWRPFVCFLIAHKKVHVIELNQNGKRIDIRSPESCRDGLLAVWESCERE